MYYSILAKIKNAERARKETFQTPFSNFDNAVAKVLEEKGFIAGAEKRTVGKKFFLEITLKYKKGEPAMTDFKIMSKPSRRFYKGYRELKPVRQNYGIAVISTPSGVMSNKEAGKKKLGGEYLFEVW